MNRPPEVPEAYLYYKGDWCHPSRVPEHMRVAAQVLDGDMYYKPTSQDAAAIAQIHKDAANMRAAKAHPRRIRQDSKPLLNKLEQRYLGYLSMIYVGHPIISQGIKFRLANGCWYCPDFVVWGDENNRTRAFEVKGDQQLQDDSAVKIKVAAKEYHWIAWYLVWWRDNQWKEQLVLA